MSSQQSTPKAAQRANRIKPPGNALRTVFADERNVINFEVDDYFKSLMRFDNGIRAEVELGTYYLADKVQDKWFERHWFVGGTRTMTSAGPTRSFGPAPDGTVLTEPLPQVDARHENYFENYVRAYHGEGDFLVKLPETRRVLRLMDAVRESVKTGRSIDFKLE